jgi:hypothetical protein
MLIEAGVENTMNATRPEWVIVSVLCALGLNAQTAGWPAVKSLAAGTEIRVDTAHMRGRQGLVGSVSDDALIFTPSKKGSKGDVTIPRQEVTRLSVKTRGHRTRNALIGAGIGGGTGLGVGLAARCAGQFACPLSNGELAGGATAVGAVIGAIVGGFLPSGGWHDIYRQQ